MLEELKFWREQLQSLNSRSFVEKRQEVEVILLREGG